MNVTFLFTFRNAEPLAFFSLFTNLPRKSKWHRASEFFFPLLMSEIEDFR
ncbi:hypothetical protein P301_N11581 [Saccharomyces cerevisiae P301]|nr:hypothetical protein P301_N11581 [Saccharomyces cerevisiae P301]